MIPMILWAVVGPPPTPKITENRIISIVFTEMGSDGYLLISKIIGNIMIPKGFDGVAI